jgi:hypothetical protein
VTKIKKLLALFLCFFIFLMFMTWQQVTIFRLGYKLTGLKESVKDREIENQLLLREFNRKCSLFDIDRKAGASGMVLPSAKACRSLFLDKEKNIDNKGSGPSLVAILKKALSPSDAQAK